MKNGKDWLAVLAAMTGICLYPCLFQYAINLPESRFGDAMLFFGIYLLCGAVILGLSGLIFRDIWRAGTISCLAELIVTNFGLINSGIQKLLPWFHGYFLLGILTLLIFLPSVWMLRKRPKCRVPVVLLLIMFLALNLTALGLTVRGLISAKAGRGTSDALLQADAAEPESGADPENLPNVYYYIYDEYAGPQGLAHYYDYNSSDFYDELEKRGFAWSADSESPEGISTVDNVPDLYNLDYAAPSYFDSTDGQMPVLYQVFREMGYQINLISHNDFLDTDGAKVLSKSQSEDSICQYLYVNSLLGYTPLSSWIEKLPQLRSRYQYNWLLQNVLGCMENAWEYTENQKPALTLGYVQMPHTKFVYTGNGGAVPEKHALDWDDPQYYLGQLEYTNDRILKAVDEIQKHDPDAVIILQSDHGVRKAQHDLDAHGTEYDPAVENPYQENILNCVYAKGKHLDLTGKSGVNTLRYLMNELYGMDYEMLPDPETAG